jgi:uncharacterized protein RhaS with RHS repeats
MYNPDMGRFVSRDPIGLAGGDVNTYRYVHNSVLSFIDPVGLKEIDPSEGLVPNSSPEGVNMLIDTYLQESNEKYKDKELKMIFNDAFLKAYNHRNDKNYNGNNSTALRDAEHYLLSRKDIENNDSPTLVQAKALAYTPIKALEQMTNTYIFTEPDSSKPSFQELWYGLKGGLDGETCKK